MISFSAELEDVVFTAVRSNEGDWTVKLEPSVQAKADFPEQSELRAELTVNDQEMAALLYLAAGGDEHEDALYLVLEPKLTGIPIELRPVP